MTRDSTIDTLPSRRTLSRRRSRGRKVALWAGAALGLIALIVGGVAATYLISLNRAYDEQVTVIDDVFPPDTARPLPVEGPSANSINILLIGSDTRGQLVDDIDDPRNNSLADVIMVMHISPDRENVYVMSIPRDSWVEQPDGSMGKINWAFGSGAAAGLVQAVEGIIDVPIDHVAAIDFEGFRGVTDALGGVTVNNMNAFSRSGYDFPVGPVELNGRNALIYVRERQFTGGDAARVQQQQEYLRAMLAKTISAETLTDPAKIMDVVSSVSPYLSVDSELTGARVAGLAAELRNVRPGDIEFFAMPTDGGGFVGDQAVVFVEERTKSIVATAFRNGNVGGLIDLPRSDARG